MKKFLHLLMMLVVAIGVANAQEEKPLFSFGCMSDIHNELQMISASNVENIYLRPAFLTTLNKIKAEENLDLLVLGGDYTSDVTISKNNWERVRTLMNEATRGAFASDAKHHPVIYALGNHDYEVANFDNIPKPYNAGDYYTYPMKDELGALDASECYYETADNGSLGTQELLVAYHYVIRGYDFVVMNCGKNFFKYAWDYSISDESVAWVDKKLDEITKDDANKTVFFIMHLPLPDSSGVTANKTLDRSDAATSSLVKALAKHPGLLYIYGHDHSSTANNSFIEKNITQRITHYDTNGNVIAAPSEGSGEGTGTGDGGETTDFTVQLVNVASNQYLGFNSYNMCVTSTAYDFLVKESTITSGCVSMYCADGHVDQTGSVAGYIHCGSSGRFSGNAEHTIYSAVNLYEINTATLQGTKVEFPEYGKTYAIVNLSSAGGYYALGNEMYNAETSGQRMPGKKVSDSAPGETITIESTAYAWQFKKAKEDATPTPTPDPVDAKYTIQDATGKYLVYSGNMCCVASDANGYTFSASTVTSSPWAGSDALNVFYNSSDNRYLHCGTGGKFSGNTSIGDANTGTSVWLYEINGTTATKVSAPTSGKTYAIVGYKSGGYYQLTNQDNGVAVGESYRLIGEALSIAGPDDSFTFNGNTNATWTITMLGGGDEGGSGASGEDSFYSTFMGSMRYNSLDTNATPGVNDSPIVQALMVYVYKDKIVLNMKNYGQTGHLSGAAVTTDITNPIPAYTITREVTNSDVKFNYTVSTEGEGTTTGSESGEYSIYDDVETAAVAGADYAFEAWNVTVKSGGTVIATGTYKQVCTALGLPEPADETVLSFRQSDWKAALKSANVTSVDVDATAVFKKTDGIGTILADNANEVAIFAADGRRLSEPVKGVNLVRMSDGTVRKILIK